MTAQAPYESLSRMADKLGMAVASADPLTAASVNRIAAELRALAALPERAPVSDAVSFRWNVAGAWSGWSADWAQHDLAKRMGYEVEYSYPSDRATPASPVGADWTDEQCIAFMAVALRHTEYKRGNGGPTLNEIRQGVRRALMLAAAPTPAEARGVGDGVRALPDKWRVEGLDVPADIERVLFACADELEAALAANKPAGKMRFRPSTTRSKLATPAKRRHREARGVVVPRELPPEVLAGAAFAMETGNPKHLWDFILAKVARHA